VSAVASTPAAAAPAPDVSPAERVAKLREAKEKREKERADRAEQLELEELELEERLEREHGERGKAFEIVSTIDGPVAVKLGDSSQHKRITKAKEITDKEIHAFVFPNVVHPSKEKYLELVARRPEIAGRCGHALFALFGAKEKDDQGKY